MSYSQIKSELIAGGLHTKSVERALEDYEKMRLYLSNGNYPEVGSRVGSFCENMVNILLDAVGEDIVESDVSINGFVNRATSRHYGIDHKSEDSILITIPRALRAAYEIRSKRDSVHVNLKVPCNHADSQTAVRLCNWILCELLRSFGEDDHMDEIAALIEGLATPLTPYIDSYNGSRVIMHDGLEVREEVLIHLHALGTEIEASKLSEWIPSGSPQQVGGVLGRLKQQRKVHYEKGTAKITPRGHQEAQQLVEKYFDEGIKGLAESGI